MAGVTSQSDHSPVTTSTSTVPSFSKKDNIFSFPDKYYTNIINNTSPDWRFVLIPAPYSSENTYSKIMCNSENVHVCNFGFLQVQKCLRLAPLVVRWITKASISLLLNN